MFDSRVKDIATSLLQGLETNVKFIAHWFYTSMPDYYLKVVDREDQILHLSTILSGRFFELDQSVTGHSIMVKNKTGTKVTFIAPAKERFLTEILEQSKNFEISSIDVYTSKDNLLTLCIFETTGHKASNYEADHLNDVKATLTSFISEELNREKAESEEYVSSLRVSYLLNSTMERLKRHATIFFLNENLDGTYLNWDETVYDDSARLDIATSGENVHSFFEQLMMNLRRWNYRAPRAFVNVIQGKLGRPTTLMATTYLTDGDKRKLKKENIDYQAFHKSLVSMRWVKSDELDILLDQHQRSLNEVNWLRANAELLHIFLSKEDIYYYNLTNIKRAMLDFSDLSIKLIRLFKIKMDPRKSENREENFKNARQELLDLISDISDPVKRRVFEENIRIIDYTLRTNYFLIDKTGLSFRFDSAILNPKYYPNTPFAFYYCFGKNYRGFQCRFADMARGGMRALIPRSQEMFEKECDRLFDEVINLSQAQQFKNKDIPEGGSKAAILVDYATSKDEAVKGMVKGILDLLTYDKKGKLDKEHFVDYLNETEYLYLGPDENITSDLINWISDTAKKMDYRYPNAFMSSKLGIGINHKEYGVTSEGVNVYLRTVLEYLGFINPETGAQKEFSVKMTGGPDGDVAGNLIKIFHREYRGKIKVCAIVDATGAAYDPDGLELDELFRLANESLGIRFFDQAKLKSKKAKFVIADTEKGIKFRDSLINSVSTDIFVPAGGRPFTINDDNWEDYLDAKGVPTSSAVVEGANIFFTQYSREKLEELGLLFIKDFSANKTGVICSSYEVLANLLLEEKTFLSIKENYVKEVLDLIRGKAKKEAMLLFREYEHNKKTIPLTELSAMISKEINSLKSAIMKELSSNKKNIFLDDQAQNSILYAYLPENLKQHSGEEYKNLPKTYRIAVVATEIACKIVYDQGVGWLTSLRVEESEYINFIQSYLKNDHLANDMLSQIESSNLKNKSAYAELIRKTATRELTRDEYFSNFSKF